MDKNIEILGKIIDLLRENGIKINSPYDVQNWFSKVYGGGSHSAMWETGRFKEEGN